MWAQGVGSLDKRSDESKVIVFVAPQSKIQEELGVLHARPKPARKDLGLDFWVIEKIGSWGSWDTGCNHFFLVF